VISDRKVAIAASQLVALVCVILLNKLVYTKLHEMTVLKLSVYNHMLAKQSVMKCG
jgi:hypothetical protein